MTPDLSVVSFILFFIFIFLKDCPYLTNHSIRRRDEQIRPLVVFAARSRLDRAAWVPRRPACSFRWLSALSVPGRCCACLSPRLRDALACPGQWQLPCLLMFAGAPSLTCAPFRLLRLAFLPCTCLGPPLCLSCCYGILRHVQIRLGTFSSQPLASVPFSPLQLLISLESAGNACKRSQPTRPFVYIARNTPGSVHLRRMRYSRLAKPARASFLPTCEVSTPASLGSPMPARKDVWLALPAAVPVFKSRRRCAMMARNPANRAGSP